MSRLIASRVALLLWAATVAGAVVLNGAPKLRSMGNDRFEIVGLHLRSVTYVNELSLVVGTIAERYLMREGMAFPLPILVSLRPAEHVNFEGDYQIRIEARNAVKLDIRWEDPLTLERTCRALAEALLVQYALYNHGQGVAEELRAWPVDALARDIYLSLRPAEFITLIGDMRPNELPPPATLLASTRLSPGVAARGYGYTLLEAMKMSGLDRRILRSLFQQAIAGMDIGEALASAIQPTSPTAEPLSLETWWGGQMTALLGRDYEVVETMETSRTWLATLARFDEPMTQESGERKLNLRSIRTHRDQPQVRDWVEARYEILRLRMTRVNPAYYNAARSLGVLFEALLEESPPHEYLHALTIYLSDWEDTKAMQAMIENKLDPK